MKKLFAVALGILTAIGGFVDIGDLVTNAQVGARFGGEQPTPADDADYTEVTGAMSDASDLLAQTRIAIVRRDTAAYPGLLSDLEQVHGDLERVRQGLR